MRSPTAGSPNYIQANPSSAQNTSFNISGNGSVGGALSAGTQFNIGGNRVLSNAGMDNLFAGVGAGQSNTAGGSFNSFFGGGAGSSNTNGANNSFFGFAVGASNNAGSSNSFFGVGAGNKNTMGGSNSFFGESAGFSNATGSGNTIIGSFADVGSGGLTNATAIGAFAQVTQSNSLVLGSIKNVNGATADTSVGIGTTLPVFRLHVVDPGAAGLRVQTNTGGGAVASFGGNGDFQIDSNGTTAGRFIVQQGGNVGIGTASPDNKLTVNGTADKPGGGSWGTFSDERLKNIKGRFTPGLNAVMQLHPIRYEYKRDNALNLKSEGEHIGFSAQAVRKIIPEAVSQNDKGYLLVNNDPILWTMLNAIKEQQGQIDTLRTANAALNARLRALEKSRRKRVSSRRSRD